MAKKKKNGLLKVAVGVGAAAVAGKVAYDKVKAAKNKLTKEEQDSEELEVRKYNSVCEKRMVEVEDEEFMGCEVKAIASKLTVDLSLAVFEKDVYINFESISSNVSVVLPDGVNVTCDIEKRLANVRNYVENTDEDGIHTVYIIGKAALSKVEVVPVNFYVDDDDDYEDVKEDFDDSTAFPESDDVEITVINKSEHSDDSEADSTSDDNKDGKTEDKTEDTVTDSDKEDEEDVLAGIEIEDAETLSEDKDADDKNAASEDDKDKKDTTETISLEEV